MPLCATCGNEFKGRSSCPYCGGLPQGYGRRRNRTTVIVTVNLEAGRPTVDDALARLDIELGAARMRGARLIRLIHGYGSSGEGGAIRSAVRMRLKTLRPRCTIIPGESYSADTNGGRRLLASYPRLRESLRTDSHNPGITFVEL